MTLARLIVCETTSKWAVALRRQMPAGICLPICETRSLDDCWQQAKASGASAVVLEVTAANLEHLAGELPRYRAKLPHAPVLVVGSRRLAAAEWLMRELGAVHVVFSTRAMDPLVRMIQRHWDRANQRFSQDASPWHRLPWAGAAGRGDRVLIQEPDWLSSERR